MANTFTPTSNYPLRNITRFIPFSTDLNINPSEPIYLIDIDGTLINGDRLKDNMITFLRSKPNIYLFTKMTIGEQFVHWPFLNETFNYQ